MFKEEFDICVQKYEKMLSSSLLDRLAYLAMQNDASYIMDIEAIKFILLSRCLS